MAVSFTDEKLRIIDFRTGPSQTQDIGNATMQLEGEHSDIIKRIVLSPDGTLLISAGQDGLVKIWDLGMRRCIQTIGDNGLNFGRGLGPSSSQQTDFHRDTISAIDINFDEELMFTGGRDGAMFMTKLGENFSENQVPY